MVHWFDVDKDGLGKLLERRGKSWILAELLQNAWDAPGATEVELRLSPIAGRPFAELEVRDNSPEGFAHLEHAFTLFGESVKKQDPTLRGRFNLGEKLVLALCQEALIETTKGTVLFNDKGRSTSRKAREFGTSFRARLRLSRAEIEEALSFARSFIAPPGISTVINGVDLDHRQPLGSFEIQLPTEVADPEGVLRRTRRKTLVSVYRPTGGMGGRIYELGIPVMETGDSYDVDIGQKVPLSFDRDAVTPGYLRDVRVGVLNHLGHLLGAEEVNQAWVSDALEARDVQPSAVREVLVKRFGDKVVSYDPSDREANDRAVAAGYTVLRGGHFSALQWDNVRASGLVRPAGQVTPTPKPFSPDGEPAVHVEPTSQMEAFAAWCRHLGRELLNAEIRVNFLERFNAIAAYSPGVLSFNVGRLGKNWFSGPLRAEQLDLVIHEFGHHFESNHLSKRYNDALTRLGAATTMLALASPPSFELERFASPSAVLSRGEDPEP